MQAPLLQGWGPVAGFPQAGYPQYSGYSGIDGFGYADHVKSNEELFAPGKRRRVNWVPIVINIVFPWVVFCALMVLCSFKMHYDHPTFIYMAVFGVLILNAAIAYRGWSADNRERQPMWLKFAACCLFLALLTGTGVGSLNFYVNMKPFYDLEGMNTYVNIDPSDTMGQSIMDAGRIYFSEGSELDLSKAMSFKNVENFCVAPVRKGAGTQTSYDAWAVGMNCCSDDAPDFRCGQFNNPLARSGIRLMDATLVPNFRDAVQMAESAYGIQALHPIFVYWVQDPVGEMMLWRQTGVKWFVIANVTFIVVQLFAVVNAVFLFSKIGRY